MARCMYVYRARHTGKCGLRDYGTAQWEGGDAECDHKHGGQVPQTKHLAAASNFATGTRPGTDNSKCKKCGAKRIDRQLGQEPTPDAYVQTMVEVFREVRRVLHDSGTVWLNVGDSYSGSWGNYSGQNRGKGKQRDIVNGSQVDNPAYDGMETMRPPTANKQQGLKEKDLCLIPWRLAIALQADGWWVRSVICWAKKSCMPESVTDRPTNSWEPIFLLAKSQRYFYDAEAVKEQAQDRGEIDESKLVRAKRDLNREGEEGRFNRSGGNAAGFGATGTRNQRNVWTLGPEPYAEAHFATFPTEIPRRAILAGTSARGCCPKCYAPWTRIIEKDNPPNDGTTESQYAEGMTANRLAMKRQAARERGEEFTNKTRTVGWEPGCECDGIDRRIVSSPTGERAGDDPSLETGRAGMNRPRGSAEGQRPITRYEQAQYAAQLKASTNRKAMEAEAGEAFAHYVRTDDSGARPIPAPLLEAWIERGWLARVTIPDTEPLAPIPCTVLDPFGGSGTTGQVALELARHAILCELSPEYAKLIERRTDVTPGLALH